MTGRRLLLALWLHVPIGAGVAMLASGAAYSQNRSPTQFGSYFKSKPTTVTLERLAMFRKGFATCVFNRHQTLASRVLENSDPMTVDNVAVGLSDGQFSKALGLQTCLREQTDGVQAPMLVSFPVTTIRSLLQEEAYLSKYNVPPTTSPDDLKSIDRRYVSTGDALPKARASGQFADCIVAQDVARSDALLRAAPGSEDEGKAARALAPALGKCLFEGENVSLKTENVRAFVADGLWMRFVRNSAVVTQAAR